MRECKERKYYIVVTNDETATATAFGNTAKGKEYAKATLTEHSKAYKVKGFSNEDAVANLNLQLGTDYIFKPAKYSRAHAEVEEISL